jgi:hypothetical protein
MTDFYLYFMMSESLFNFLYNKFQNDTPIETEIFSRIILKSVI